MNAATHCAMKTLLAAGLLALAAGCTSGVKIQEPSTARPVVQARAPQQNGAIFQDSISYRPMFEDRRARYVGDTLTVTISEKTAASKNNDGSASRDASLNMGIPVVQGVPLKTLQGTSLQANASSSQTSKEATAANNVFTGTIAVTVVDVLPNGNLIVSGEKQIGINNEIEKLRFSGVVNPLYIVNGNQVSSTNIADARIEVASHSKVDAEQVMGFVGRFFLSFLPFR